jgi:hypothetical protein
MMAVTRARVGVFGDVGAAEQVALVHFVEEKQEAVLRVHHRYAAHRETCTAR